MINPAKKAAELCIRLKQSKSDKPVIYNLQNIYFPLQNPLFWLFIIGTYYASLKIEIMLLSGFRW